MPAGIFAPSPGMFGEGTAFTLDRGRTVTVRLRKVTDGDMSLSVFLFIEEAHGQASVHGDPVKRLDRVIERLMELKSECSDPSGDIRETIDDVIIELQGVQLGLDQ